MEGAKIWMINILEDETAQAHSKKGSTVMCRSMNMLYLLYKDTISSGHLEHCPLVYLRVGWAIARSGGGGWLRTVGGESTALTRARPASMWGLINIPIYSHRTATSPKHLGESVTQTQRLKIRYFLNFIFCHLNIVTIASHLSYWWGL